MNQASNLLSQPEAESDFDESVGMSDEEELRRWTASNLAAIKAGESFNPVGEVLVDYGDDLADLGLEAL